MCLIFFQCTFRKKEIIRMNESEDDLLKTETIENYLNNDIKSNRKTKRTRKNPEKII